MKKSKRNLVMIIVLSAMILVLWFVPIIFYLINKRAEPSTPLSSIGLLYFAVFLLSVGYGYILNEYLIRKED